MTRSEILQISKPILFNTEMVRAILGGKKTVTRRVVKPQPEGINDIIYMCNGNWYISPDDCGQGETPVKPPYEPDCYLYVRETWNGLPARGIFPAEFWYKADEKMLNLDEKWRPSIHMPKEAARIFLRVTDVRVERLKDMTADSAMSEGFADWNDVVRVWDSTIPPKDRDKYGWAANPYVWVIEFERVEVTE